MIATADRFAGSVICVLDAPDECDDQERPELIGCIGKFCYQQRTSPSISRPKVLVASRPYFNIRREFGREIKAVNDIELAEADESASIKKEIDLVIKYRVISLECKDYLKSEVIDHLRSRLLEMEHRTYL